MARARNPARGDRGRLRLVKVDNDAIPEVRPAAEELARLAAKAISREELTLADTSLLLAQQPRPVSVLNNVR